MKDTNMERSPHPFFLNAIRQSTYRSLLSDEALSVLKDIACDEEYAGSGDAHSLSLLATFIHACQMTKVLQIGTWIGFSTVALAGALAHVEADRVPTLYTVDPALSEFEKSKEYVRRAHLADHVEFIYGSSLDESVQKRISEFAPYDLVFIDSQHDFDVASSELRTFWPLVKEGGMLFAHDSSKASASYDSKNQGGVVRAIAEWIQEEHLEQYIFLTPPLWNPVGLFLAFKMPLNESPSGLLRLGGTQVIPATERRLHGLGNCEVLGQLQHQREDDDETIATRSYCQERHDEVMVLQVNAKAPSEQYRVHNVSEQLDQAGTAHRIISLPEVYADSVAAEKLFARASIVIFHRVAYDSVLNGLCTRARARGTALVCETDDLTFFPDLDPRWVDGLRYLPPVEVPLYYEGVERYQRLLEICDFGLFSTDFLASLSETFGKPSWVLRNALGVGFLKAAGEAYQHRKSSATDTVRIGYCSGTKTHDRDFAEFAPVLLRVMESDPRLQLAILGPLQLPPGFSKFGVRVQMHDPVPWQKVPHILSTFDIDLAPLQVGNPFCRAKSELKYFEAGAVAVPTIASSTEAFKYAIENGRNGFLVSSEVELEESLLRLINDRDFRQVMGEEARRDVLSRYTPAARSRDWLAILSEILKSLEGSPAVGAASTAHDSSLRIRDLVRSADAATQ